MKLAVLSCADGQSWEASLVTALDRGPLGVAIVRRCVDVVDLLAVAASGQGRVALLSAGLRRLDADVVERLLASDVVPVAVLSRGDEHSEARMRAIGVIYVVPDDADPGVVASVIGEAVRDAELPPGARRTFGDTASIPISTVARDSPARAEPPRDGIVIAVWGPTGAPGRTTIAVALTDELARLGPPSLLVDADVYGGVIAAVLGVLDESPGFAAACRQATSTGLDEEGLAALCWQLRPHLRVLTGIPLAARWPELRPTAVASVLNTARALADFVVVDCGFCLETDEELSFDTLAPRRNGATLAVLDEADVIIAVGSADPIGMQRLVRGLADLREVETDAPVWTVLNRVRASVVPGDLELELRGALERFAGSKPAALLPFDPAVDVAVATGQFLSDVSSTGPFRTSVMALAADLAGVTDAEAVGRGR